MTAQIKLKKVTGINEGNKKVVATVVDNQKEMLISSIGANKLVFVGQDYKGTLDNSAAGGKGTLELSLDGPGNSRTIEGVKIKSPGTHSLSSNGKDAVIEIEVKDPKISEKDTNWLTTQLNLGKFDVGTIAAPSTIKFGEWNSYDLDGYAYVEITFI